MRYFDFAAKGVKQPISILEQMLGRKGFLLSHRPDASTFAEGPTAIRVAPSSFHAHCTNPYWLCTFRPSSPCLSATQPRTATFPRHDERCIASALPAMGAPPGAGMFLTRSSSTLVQLYASTAMPGEVWMVTSLTTTSTELPTTTESRAGLRVCLMQDNKKKGGHGSQIAAARFGVVGSWHSGLHLPREL